MAIDAVVVARRGRVALTWLRRHQIAPSPETRRLPHGWDFFVLYGTKPARGWELAAVLFDVRTVGGAKATPVNVILRGAGMVVSQP